MPSPTETAVTAMMIDEGSGTPAWPPNVPIGRHWKDSLPPPAAKSEPPVVRTCPVSKRVDCSTPSSVINTFVAWAVSPSA